MTGPPPPRTPQGPCRREMEDVLSRLKFLNTLSPRGAHIPNCDRKGFYKKKQVSGCRPRPLARGQPPQPRPLLPPGRAESPSPSGKGPRDPEGHNTPPANTHGGRTPSPGVRAPCRGLRVGLTPPPLLRPQCRPSKGRKRGFCWCVDKYGQPLPGHGAKGRGDVHCDGAESK